MLTAIIHAFDYNQRPVERRTLLDTCSNANFITEDFASILNLPMHEQSVNIEVLNELHTVTNRIAKVKNKSRLNQFHRTLTFFLIPRIAGLLPDSQINRNKLQIPPNIQLADPTFHKPSHVNMLIGTGTTLASFSIGQVQIHPQV